jgi:hypothetical protein
MHFIFFRQAATLVFTALFFILTSCTTQTKVPTAATITAKNGMVVSAHPDAS